MVRVECVVCEVPFEADDSAAVSEWALTHSEQTHPEPHSPELLRNWARNVTKAIERLTGETDRLERIGEVTVHRVTEDRIDDWHQFFDHDAFAGNPDWASCYCLEPFDGGGDGAWEDRRALMVERLRSGSAFGYLAYVEGRPAGWVNASLRSEYGNFYTTIDPGGPEPSSVIGVSCFVIAPPFRGHGVASALLDHVISEAGLRGASAVEAYPHTDRRDSGAEHLFRGPASMFRSRGFEVVATLAHNTVMRLPVD